MFRFLFNVTRLFVTIVGFTFFLAFLTVILDSAWKKYNEPVYRPAATADYFYTPGVESSDYMTGAVQLSAKRGFQIELLPIEGLDTPVMFFFDKNGNEIPESRMEGLWTLYDTSVRFGVYPQGSERPNAWATCVELITSVPIPNFTAK
jgi:hypothetical protein